MCFPIVKEYPTGFTVGEVISIHLTNGGEEQRDLAFQHHCPPMPYIRVANIDAFASRLSDMGVTVTPVSEQRSIKAIRLSDPFGNELEFFEGR